MIYIDGMSSLIKGQTDVNKKKQILTPGWLSEGAANNVVVMEGVILVYKIFSFIYILGDILLLITPHVFIPNYVKAVFEENLCMIDLNSNIIYNLNM